MDSLSRDDLNYIDATDYCDVRNSIAPSRGRASTPSLAVRRAMKVLDDTYKMQSYLKIDRLSRGQSRASSRPMRSQRSISPLRSPIRSPSPALSPPRLVALERDNFEDALGDSESRRGILLNKLKEAQTTMEMQNERLRLGEADVIETRATVRLLQQIQVELETKIEFLEKERVSLLGKSRQEAEDREILKRRVEDGGRENNKLRCQLDLLLADKHEHQVTLDHLHKTINAVKDEKDDVLKLHTSCCDELNVTKERLLVARQRCDLIEKEKSHAFTEAEKLQKSQQSLINRNTELGQRNARQATDLNQITERFERMEAENSALMEELAICQSELKKRNKDLIDLRRKYKDTSEDMMRVRKYNVELEKTVQTIKEINKDLKKVKVDYENDITDLHGDLAKLRLELSTTSNENKTNITELKRTMDVYNETSNELGELRFKYEEETKSLRKLESCYSVAAHQVALLEAEKNRFVREEQENKLNISTLEENLEKLKDKYESETSGLLEEVAGLKSKKQILSLQLEEAEAQLMRVNEEMKSHDRHATSQLDHWRQTCAKLTTIVENKERERRESTTRWMEVEEKLRHSEAQQSSLLLQLSGIESSNERANRLEAEVNRLLQEQAENQQMISVLEMQRDILAKSPTKADASEEIYKQRSEKLEMEVNLLKTKLNNVGKVGPDSSGATKEDLLKSRQEVAALKVLLKDKSTECEDKVGRLLKEKEQLRLEVGRLCGEINSLNANQSQSAGESILETQKLRDEILFLKQRVDESRHKIQVLEGERVILINGKKRLEDRVRGLEAEVEHRRVIKSATVEHRTTDESTTWKVRLKELNKIKSSQDDVIDALKKQIEQSTTSISNDDVIEGSLMHEVNSLKRKLQEKGKYEVENVELKSRLEEIEKLEQKARQERDELQGKMIIMESLNDSSQDLLKELEEVREGKMELEQQLNSLLGSKTCQTPPGTLSLVEDMDNELEQQYNIMRERNKWLETRISSLQREVDLVRDQNSLLHQQRSDADHEAGRSVAAFKIIDLERELSEKNQIIRSMNNENSRKKNDKSKISSFMKKLRRSSDSRDMMSSGGIYDPGYSTLMTDSNLKSRSSSFGGFPQAQRSSLKTSAKSSHLSHLTPPTCDDSMLSSSGHRESPVFYPDDYIEDRRPPSSSEPTPSKPHDLPTPTSSPSLPSPTSSRRHKPPVYVMGASEESASDDDVIATSQTPTKKFRTSHETGDSPPPRPQSQPIVRDVMLSPPNNRKKHSSLV
uniref:myosin-8 isoform X3 n=1 Tax=Ciona intestinalis TaxID=7719 RepID=UPI000EF4E30F|nr:myosin-8 isoform X3 [Ciona intestinalis]|eukprot:XP_026695707.1 myosin-8 isoform X3 [Ciona intestinalis]